MFRELRKTYAFWGSIFCPITVLLYFIFDKPVTVVDYITLILVAVLYLLSIIFVILKIREIKKKGVISISKKPTHWALGHSLRPELGFDDGTYLMRNAGKILYPEYFDENGEPRLDMLPLDGQDRKKWWKEHQKENGDD